jgi:hypothetical protein
VFELGFEGGSGKSVGRLSLLLIELSNSMVSGHWRGCGV